MSRRARNAHGVKRHAVRVHHACVREQAHERSGERAQDRPCALAEEQGCRLDARGDVVYFVLCTREFSASATEWQMVASDEKRR